MKKVTIKRIGMGSLVKWHVTYNLIIGVLVGLVYGVGSYLYTGANLSGHLLLYGLGMPALYLFVGVMVSITISILFNALSDSSGGLVLEIDIDEDSDPPPPTFPVENI